MTLGAGGHYDTRGWWAVRNLALRVYDSSLDRCMFNAERSSYNGAGTLPDRTVRTLAMVSTCEALKCQWCPCMQVHSSHLSGQFQWCPCMQVHSSHLGSPDCLVAYHPDTSYQAVVEALGRHEAEGGEVGAAHEASGQTYWLPCFACHQHETLWTASMNTREHI